MRGSRRIISIMFWADAVTRSRTERLGRAKASQLRKQQARETEMTDSEKARLADVWIQVPPPAPDVMLDAITPEVAAPAVRSGDVVSQLVFSAGQQVDAFVTSTITTTTTTTTTSDQNLNLNLNPSTVWKNATVLDVDPTQGVHVGFRLYHNSGPFTEFRGGGKMINSLSSDSLDVDTKKSLTDGRAALKFARLALRTGGEIIPDRYFGESQASDAWIREECVAPLGSRSLNLLGSMGVDISDTIMGSLSRRELRRERVESGDVSGASSMDRAMLAYHSDRGPLHFYTSPKKDRYSQWRSSLSPMRPVVRRPGDDMGSSSGSSSSSTVVEEEKGGEEMESEFIPSLCYDGEHDGFQYELQHRGLGYYAQPIVSDSNKIVIKLRERRKVEIKQCEKELDVCIRMRQSAEEARDERIKKERTSLREKEGEEMLATASDAAAVNNNGGEDGGEDEIPALRERECDVRLQLAMLMRLEIEALWRDENVVRPPLPDEHQCGPIGEVPLLMARKALVILRGILLLDSEHASARLNSIEIVGMLPVSIRSEFYGGSFTFDNVYSANPNVYPRFVQKRVTRTKFYDPEYRLLESYGGFLPARAWLNIVVRRPGETKDALVLRANRVVRPIQRCYRARYNGRGSYVTYGQKLWRGHMVRKAVLRKRVRETRCAVFIFAVWRGFKWRRELWWLNVYATRMTSLARGKHGRWMAHLARIVRDHPRAPFLVVRIQQRVRGVQSRWHQLEAKRRLKSLRFLVRLGVWMLRMKKRRNDVILTQSIVRRRLTYIYELPKAWERLVGRKVIGMQALFRGKMGRRRAVAWIKGILRFQGLCRAIRSRWCAGQELNARLLHGFARDEEERLYVSERIRTAVESVRSLLLGGGREGKRLVRIHQRLVSKSVRSFWWKRKMLYLRAPSGSRRPVILRKARLASLFQKYDWNRNGRLTIRAFKSLIVDDLCVPLTPDGFRTLLLLLDGRTVRGGATSIQNDLSRLLDGQSYDVRGSYVTFESFDRWWNARNGRRSLLEVNKREEEKEKLEVEEEERLKEKEGVEEFLEEWGEVVDEIAAIVENDVNSSGVSGKEAPTDLEVEALKFLEEEEGEEEEEEGEGEGKEEEEGEEEEEEKEEKDGGEEEDDTDETKKTKKKTKKKKKKKKKNKQKKEEEEEESTSAASTPATPEVEEEDTTQTSYLDLSKKKVPLKQLLKSKYAYNDIRKPKTSKLEPARMNLFENDDMNGAIGSSRRAAIELRTRKTLGKICSAVGCCSGETNSSADPHSQMYRGGGQSGRCV